MDFAGSAGTPALAQPIPLWVLGFTTAGLFQIGKSIRGNSQYQEAVSMSDTSPMRSNDLKTMNPYEPPQTESVAGPNTDPEKVSVMWLLLWTLFVPALVANVLLGNYLVSAESILHELRRFYEPSFGNSLIVVVPLVGMMYGGLIGYWLYCTTLGKYPVLHPLVQGFLQPFWFVISMATTCFVILSIMEGF